MLSSFLSLRMVGAKYFIEFLPCEAVEWSIIMTDYKAMYYYLAGRMATTLEVLDATTTALATITEKMKQAG